MLNVEATLVAGDEREPAMLDLAYDQQLASNYGLVSDGGPSQNPF